MNEFESRMRKVLDPLSSGFSKLWARAIEALHEMRESGAGKRAASAVHDLRESDASKRAAAAMQNVRESDAGKRAANAWNDLRQRDAVKKAEETAKRAMHDLRSGHGSGTTTA